METIEQLKAENDKLKERLSNDIKIFNEQKTEIDLLNKEIDMLTFENKKLNESLNKLNKTSTIKTSSMKRIGDDMIAGENVGI